MKVIILASGASSRFKNAGHNYSKFMLPFAGELLINRLERIDGVHEFVTVHNQLDYDSVDLQVAHRAVISNKKIQILKVNAHKKGPVHSLKLINNSIDDDSPYAVCYCDFYASDFFIGKFLDHLKSDTNLDGAVLTYEGFHPHHIFSTSIYGYLKLDEYGNAVGYREKKSFTNERQKEPCSAGFYMFRSGRILRQLVHEVCNSEDEYSVKGELYVSSLYQKMIETNRKVICYSTPYFAQLGTPEDYSDSVHWVNSAKSLQKQQCRSSTGKDNKSLECNFLMLISGEGSRFVNEGYKTHKSFLPYGDSSIFVNIIQSLPSFKHYFFAVSKDNLSLKLQIQEACTYIGIKYVFIDVNTPNLGQADSFKQSIKQIDSILSIDSSLPIYVTACDSIIEFNDIQELIDNQKDAVILSKTNPYARLKPSSFSYAICSSDSVDQSMQFTQVKDLSIKSLPQCEPIDKLKFITGSFFFSSVQHANYILDELYEKITPVNSELYLDTLFQLMIRESPDTTIGFDASIYNSLGTPDEYQSGLYWLDFLKEISAL